MNTNIIRSLFYFKTLMNNLNSIHSICVCRRLSCLPLHSIKNVNSCKNSRVQLKTVVRQRYSFVNVKYHFKPVSKVRILQYKNASHESSGFDSTSILSKEQANDLVLRLTPEERKSLLTALKEFESNKVKAEYEGQLAATRWRSRFGRPSKLPKLGDVDPTGTYCHLPEDWLKQKYVKYKLCPSQTSEKDDSLVKIKTEQVPCPTFKQLAAVAGFNAIPFVGFGFLDNFIMILAGDYIEATLGTFITLTTMAAAALGNTISDVMGIGSAWYVEWAATKVGVKPPALSPVQLDMRSSRTASNLGRALGITVGCILGMLPLLFIDTSDKEKKPENIKDVK